MKTLHFDCAAGISGDMALGAFVDAGADPDALRAELSKLGLAGWTLDFVRDERCGISGTRAVVGIEGADGHHAHDDGGPRAHGHPHTGEHGHSHAHEHSHSGEHGHPHAHEHSHSGEPGHTHADGHSHSGEHGHTHAHEHSHDHGHTHNGGGHAHNSWKEIRRVIEASGISSGAKARAVDIFSRIARAESQVHGVPVDDIAFHEVGALDSIIDIAGAAICLDMLKPGRVTCGEIELGGGTVKCAHGVLPVPAPATLILCKGLPVKTGGFAKEMTTPTGAAILASVVDEFITGPAAFTEIATGYGIGARKLDRPNVLRLSWREERQAAENAGRSPWLGETLVSLEANIDDMTGEALGFLMEELFSAGALDVSYSPCVMKKSRPGVILRALCKPGLLDALRETLFKKSSTIGFRETEIRRLFLRREETPGAGFRRKTVFYGGQPLRSKIEYDDRARLAREKNVSLEESGRIIEKGETNG